MRDRVLIAHFAPSLGEPYRLSFVTFCEIVDEVVPDILRRLHGRPMTAGERLAERERRPDHSLPATPADGTVRAGRRTRRGGKKTHR